jgi:hypothetical protein
MAHAGACLVQLDGPILRWGAPLLYTVGLKRFFTGQEHGGSETWVH